MRLVEVREGSQGGAREPPLAVPDSQGGVVLLAARQHDAPVLMQVPDVPPSLWTLRDVRQRRCAYPQEHVVEAVGVVVSDHRPRRGRVAGWFEAIGGTVEVRRVRFHCVEESPHRCARGSERRPYLQVDVLLRDLALDRRADGAEPL